MMEWSHHGRLKLDNQICQLPLRVPRVEHGLHFRKNRPICSGVSSGFLTAKAFQFNKMFQGNIILEPVGSALGRRGCLITLRWSQPPSTQSLPGTGRRAQSPPEGKVWRVREGTGPGLLHNRTYQKVPGPKSQADKERGTGGGHCKPESDSFQIP